MNGVGIKRKMDGKRSGRKRGGPREIKKGKKREKTGLRFNILIDHLILEHL